MDDINNSVKYNAPHLHNNFSTSLENTCWIMIFYITETFLCSI